MPIKHLIPKDDEGDWKITRIQPSRPRPENVFKRSPITQNSFQQKSSPSERPLGSFIKKAKEFTNPLENRFYCDNKNYSFGRNRNKTPWVKYILLGLVFLFLLGSIVTLGAFAWYSRDLPTPDKLIERSIAQSTKIFDRTGKILLYEIHGDQRRTLVNLEDLPKYIKWATITTEDKYFYEHHGFNPVAIFKGTIIDPLLGKGSRGGSTLTQQFVKNAILTNERSIPRKIKELILSIQIEKKFTKDQILKMYLNEIPYGSTAYGIEAASQTYLGKSAKDLTLSEAATLAAMPKKPSYYINHQDELMARRDYILDEMLSEKYITEDQKNQAKNEKVALRASRDSITAPHFVMYVKELLSEKYGETVAEQGGLSVITTLDAEKQKIADEVVAKHGEAIAEKYNASNAALVSIDANTGDILAMIGSRDYFNDDIDGQVNVTIQPRQPGSSIKPIVYATAFEKGFTAETILFDVKTNFAASGPAYEPSNYGGKIFGPVTMRKALAGSLNIPAVKTLYLAGIDNVIALAGRMGYTTLNDRDRFGLSLVLGGGEVKLLEHTNAFATFAQEGIHRQTRAILRVEDSQKRTLEEIKPDSGTKVMEKQTARIVSDILSDNSARSYIFGESNYLTLGSIPVAAKTGTTNDNRDAWIIGYTPSLVTGVWVGNNDNSKMSGSADGSVVAAPIWNEYMKQALASQTVEQFVKPQAEEMTKPVLKGEWKHDVTIRINKITGQLADEKTPEAFVEEKQYQEAHNLLHYVNKDDPRGAVPTNPTDDPQYVGWEKGVQAWLVENKIELNLPPAQTGSTSAFGISIASPANEERLNAGDLRIKPTLTVERELSHVEYYLGDLLIGSTGDISTFAPQINNTPNDSQLITVIGYDKNGDYGSAQASVYLSNSGYDQNKLTVAWLNSIAGQAFSVDQKIYLSFSAGSSKSGSSLKVYVQTPDGVETLAATSSGNRAFNNVSFSFDKTQQTGKYFLRFETDSGIKSDQFEFEVR